MMIRISHTLIILVLLASMPSKAADAPAKVIRQVSDSFIAALKDTEISNDEEKGKEEIKEIVEKHLSPAIDFRRIAYRTMGKYYKKASKEQFLAFEESIKKSLINTYANPLLESDSRRIAEQLAVEIRNSKISGENNDKAIVETWLKIGVNEKYDVVFFFYRKKSSGAWLAENVVVEGINLSISFRNQFQRLYTEYSGNIDQIVGIWAKSRVEG